MTRFTCTTLQHLGPALLSHRPPDPAAHAKALAKIHMQLVRTLVAPLTGAADPKCTAASGADAADTSGASAEAVFGVEGVGPAKTAMAGGWGDNWYSVAEAAVGALYALHSRPAELAAAVLKDMAGAAGLVGAPGGCGELRLPAAASGPCAVENRSGE